MPEYKAIFGTGVKFTYKSILLLGFLALFPNILGAIVIDTGLGFKLHLFQYLIFLAALLYGPFGGLVAGAFGSVYTAIALNNPYIVIGNMILGFFVGYFVKNRKLPVLPAVLLAYSIQLPWLWFTDIYLAAMPLNAVEMVVWALLFGNILWAILAGLTYKRIGKLIE